MRTVAMRVAFALCAGGCTHDLPPPPDCPKGPAPHCSSDGTTIVSCGPGGADVMTGCQIDERCDDAQCKKVICAPGVGYCDHLVADNCNATGTVDARADCEAQDQVCVEDAQGAHCAAQSCQPGHVFCSSDGKSVLRCNPDGISTEEQQSCGDPDHRGNTCVNTVCVDRCTLVESGTRTTLGCHFLGAPLGLGTKPAIVIYDPQPDLPARVTIRNGLSAVTTTVDAAGYLVIPWVAAQAVDGSIDGLFGLQVSSTVPVYAWQISDGSGATGDGAVLLPEHTLGTVHYLALDDATPGAQLIGIVASAAGTTVEVTPTVATLAGDQIPAGAPGTPLTRVMTRGELLILVAAGSGLSGTRVSASAPIAVYGGTRASSGPTLHTEAPMLPWATLGKSYSAVGDRVVVVAREDGTHVTTRDGTSALDAGQVLRLDGPIAIAADRAVMVVAARTGLVAVVPDEQRLTASTIALPGACGATVASRDPGFTLDGAPATGQLVDGLFSTRDFDPLAAGLHAVTGGAHAIYTYDPLSPLALTGPFALDFVSP